MVNLAQALYINFLVMFGGIIEPTIIAGVKYGSMESGRGGNHCLVKLPLEWDFP